MPPNMTLHPTAIPLCGLSSVELQRSATLEGKSMGEKRQELIGLTNHPIIDPRTLYRNESSLQDRYLAK